MNYANHQLIHFNTIDPKTQIIMHLAYSTLPASAKNQPQQACKNLSRKCRIRYRAYKAACKKYEQEIAAIQQYMPGWQPAFKL